MLRVTYSLEEKVEARNGLVADSVRLQPECLRTTHSHAPSEQLPSLPIYIPRPDFPPRAMEGHPYDVLAGPRNSRFLGTALNQGP